MTTSEPTTGEIVEKLRQFATAWAKQKIIDDRDILLLADRLESQERDNETMRGNNFDATSVTNVLAYLDTVMGLIHCADGIKDLIVSMQGTSEELTARAEQAEAREKAAVADMHGYCKFCGGYDREEDEEPCNTCTNARTFEPDDVERTDNWEYRGQPQDGEGK